MTDTADGAAVVLAFVNAFNAEDLDGLAEVLDPDVVIHSARGARYGVDDALAWARRVSTGGLDQRIDLESIKVEGDRAVALVRKQWWWRESGKLAREEEMAWGFELRDGRVVSWQPFEDRAEALAAADVEA